MQLTAATHLPFIFQLIHNNLMAGQRMGKFKNKSMTSIRWLFDKDDYLEFAEFCKRKFIA